MLRKTRKLLRRRMGLLMLLRMRSSRVDDAFQDQIEVLFAIGNGISDGDGGRIDVGVVEVDLKILDGGVGESRQPRQRDGMQRPRRGRRQCPVHRRVDDFHHHRDMGLQGLEAVDERVRASMGELVQAAVDEKVRPKINSQSCD